MKLQIIIAYTHNTIVPARYYCLHLFFYFLKKHLFIFERERNSTSGEGTERERGIEDPKQNLC